MWRNDTECEYMYIFPLNNLARKRVINPRHPEYEWFHNGCRWCINAVNIRWFSGKWNLLHQNSKTMMTISGKRYVTGQFEYVKTDIIFPTVFSSLTNKLPLSSSGKSLLLNFAIFFSILLASSYRPCEYNHRGDSGINLFGTTGTMDKYLYAQYHVKRLCFHIDIIIISSHTM